MVWCAMEVKWWNLKNSEEVRWVKQAHDFYAENCVNINFLFADLFIYIMYLSCLSKTTSECNHFTTTSNHSYGWCIATFLNTCMCCMLLMSCAVRLMKPDDDTNLCPLEVWVTAEFTMVGCIQTCCYQLLVLHLMSFFMVLSLPTPYVLSLACRAADHQRTRALAATGWFPSEWEAQCSILC